MALVHDIELREAMEVWIAGSRKLFACKILKEEGHKMCQNCEELQRREELYRSIIEILDDRAHEEDYSNG